MEYKNINGMLEKLLLKRIRQLSSPMKPKPTGVSERLMTLKGIQAVLFDVYGTLFTSGSGDISIASEISSQQALTEALQFAGFFGNLEEAGKKGTEWLLQAIQKTHVARRKEGIDFPEVNIRDEWHNVLSWLKQENLIKGEITTEAVIRVSLEYEYRVNPVWPMPDLAKTLSSLKEKQITLGIVSNAQFYTLLLFPAFLGKSHSELGFEPDLCAWSFQSLEAKPSVNLFRGIVERLQHQYGISPEETLYVGNDKLNDIWPATQLGLKTALFAGDQRSLRLREDDVRCSGLEPDLVITQLSRLSDFIG
jgi:putative hydrolase of the HAD superfamily